MKNMDAIAKAIEIMGNKHRLEVVCHLLNSPHSFNELKRASGKMNSATLSRTLKFLQNKGIISRKVIDTRPLTVSYSLTELGKQFSKAMNEMGKWGQKIG